MKAATPAVGRRVTKLEPGTRASQCDRSTARRSASGGAASPPTRRSRGVGERSRSTTRLRSSKVRRIARAQPGLTSPPDLAQGTVPFTLPLKHIPPRKEIPAHRPSGLAARREMSFQLHLHGLSYELRVSADDGALHLDLEEHDGGQLWMGDFSAQYVEEITGRRGASRSSLSSSRCWKRRWATKARASSSMC